VHPSQWGDDHNSGRAGQLSADKNILRCLFNKKGYGGWSTTVWAQEWRMYSSTNSRSIGVLFRIRNTKDRNVNWVVKFYYSSFHGWGEYGSMSMNGQQLWISGPYGPGGSNCAFCGRDVSANVPPKRVSTIIVIAQGNHPSGEFRTTLLIFRDDSLRLPDGLEYFDDFDYAQGGWEQ